MMHWNSWQGLVKPKGRPVCRSKYQPHQGSRERTRRFIQLARARRLTL
jgi:hypothetical protein